MIMVCYIPYNYLANPYYVWDVWSIRETNDLEFKTSQITTASYGRYGRAVDVTSIVKNQFSTGTQLSVTNTLFTDPYYGVVKEL